MKDFVFIIPLTPKRLLNPVRQTLFDMMIYALKGQTSDNWNALLLGEDEKQDGNLIYINSEKSLDPNYTKEFRGDAGHTDKHHKIEIALQHIARADKKPKYLIRLDDDDLISPTVITFIENSKINYDCYADKYQALYNIADGKIALPALPWMANSIFHKYEHAITTVASFNLKLINCDHSQAFHVYYADKRVFFFPKYAPLYLRIFSQTSLHITSDQGAHVQDYARRYGFWHYYSLKDYEAYIEILVNKFQVILDVKITRNTSPTLLVVEQSKYWFNRNINRVRRKVRALLGIGNNGADDGL